MPRSLIARSVLVLVVLSSPRLFAQTAAPESADAPAVPSGAKPPTKIAEAPEAATDVWGTHFFPEDRPPPGHDSDGLDFKFGWHGFLRSPMRLATRAREDGSRSNVRSPWLVDDDYYLSGFAYTPNQETDYAEIFFMGGNRYVTGTIGLFGSLFSDAAVSDSQRQLGIAQGFVTLRYDPELAGFRLHLRVKGGSFWDRFGYLAKYDTYLFGRTHQAGLQVSAELERGPFSLRLTAGIGTHLEQLEASQGLALLRYGVARLSMTQKLELGAYAIASDENDLRQLKDIKDASLDIYGVDARFTSDYAGRLYLAASRLSAERAQYMSPVIEVLHSYGGKGLTDNYFGTESSDNGTGALKSLAWQYDYSSAALMRNFPRWAPLVRNGADVVLSVFGVYTTVDSKQASADPMINRDGRKYLKWGADLAWWPLSWFGASVRYDRVILDLDDDENGFRTLSPRLSFRVHYLGEGIVFVQYSRYGYGSRVRLRAGQVPLETLPDTDVFKVQAQLAF